MFASVSVLRAVCIQYMDVPLRTEEYWRQLTEQ